MSATAAAVVKAAIAALSDENTRKKLGWVLVAILSPVILLIAFLCSLGSGSDDSCGSPGRVPCLCRRDADLVRFAGWGHR